MFEVILEMHELINQKLLQAFGRMEASDLTVEKLTDVIFEFYKLTREIPMLKVLNSSEVDLLIHKLPSDIVEAHLQHDDDALGQMI